LVKLVSGRTLSVTPPVSLNLVTDTEGVATWEYVGYNELQLSLHYRQPISLK